MTSSLPSHLRHMATEIRDAVAAELSVARKGLRFSVRDLEWRGGVMTIVLDANGGMLDPLMEEATLKWTGNTQGTGEIISIIADESKLYASLVSGQLPTIGQSIWINPPEYLRSLLNLWSSDVSAQLPVSWRNKSDNDIFDQKLIPCHSRFPTLRSQQKAAFSLLGRQMSFLWGPPGTGKTHTLGRMIAAHAIESSDRILLLSTTNVAVDEAIVAVHNGLCEAFKTLLHSPRPNCYRFGSRFVPTNFSGAKETLIPVHNRELIRKYREHFMHVPDPRGFQAYQAWRDKLDELRKLIRDENRTFIKSSQVAAMTASYATFQYEDLLTCSPWDLIVFDEASQVSLAHAMMLAGLGHRMLFAGDPKQLSPIVQSDDERALRWIGRSPFAHMDLSTSAKCMLDEQSRMAPEICKAVSILFYGGKLRVAHDVDQSWFEERAFSTHRALGSSSVSLVSICKEAQVGRNYRGYVCPESAKTVVAIAFLLLETLGSDSLLILTPYRAQRSEIANQLKVAGLTKDLVSTIHRAQGSERLVVIVDPVRPSAEFLNSDEGRRLLNVAISRAKSRLFVIVHPDHYSNPVIYQMTQLFKPISADSLPDIHVGAKPTASMFGKEESRRSIIGMPDERRPFNMEEQFKNALYERLSARLHSSNEQRWVIEDVAYSPRFASLSWAVRDELVR